MSAKKPALGRGLEALFRAPAPVPTHSGGAPSPPPAPPAPESPATPGVTLRRIPIDLIEPNPHQPRKDFDPDKLAELAASIRESGVLQPILLRKSGEKYQLVVGERRWRAAQQVGLFEIPALVRDLDEQEMAVAAIVENVQRDDLNAIEEAEAYQSLQQQHGLTQDAIAQTVGKSRVAITNALRLLRLPALVLDWVRQDKMSAGHARALLALESQEAQRRLAQDVLARGLSVRETERMARELAVKSKPGAGKSNGINPDHVDFKDLQEKMSAHLGMRVRIQPMSNASGRIEVYYSSLDDFQRFCDNLGLKLESDL